MLTNDDIVKATKCNTLFQAVNDLEWFAGSRIGDSFNDADYFHWTKYDRLERYFLLKSYADKLTETN